MSRRLRTPSCRQLLREVEHHLRAKFPHRCYKWIDARPLSVGGSTEDPDAGYGRAAGCKAKGYKLYAICDPGEAVDAWEVHPMNVSENKVAERLIPCVGSEGYLVGDKLYDANSLYDVAWRWGLQLIAPKRCGRDVGHHRHSPHRLRALELTRRPFGQELLHTRPGIDRFFGHMSNFGGLRRVRLWVQAKIIINAVRLAQKQRLIA